MVTQLERDLGAVFFGAPRKARPCKHWRMLPDDAVGRQRFFHNFSEAIAVARTVAGKSDCEVEVMSRAHYGRARCPNSWYAPSYHVQPNGDVFYGNTLLYAAGIAPR